MTIDEKYEKLQNILRSYGSVAVAFSSGVDSTFLLRAAKDALGDKVIAVTARSHSFPERELKESEEFCRANGIRQIICESEELEIEGFKDNPRNRCYLCKHELFEKITKIAEENGISYVAEGSNIDDNGDYRPGLAAVSELGIKSPLREAGLKKDDIRELSKRLGLPTWNKQSFACLASRFVYGQRIDEEKLSMVERAEQLLIDLGFGQVRVRIHQTEGERKESIARIELAPYDFSLLLKENIRRQVYDEFKAIGFAYVTMDLMGYRTGSMNEGIVK